MAKVLKAELVVDDRVIVEPDPVETETKGGIIIPDSAQEIPLVGTVVGVGFGTHDVKMVLKVGDRVLYSKGVGVKMKIQDDVFLVMRQGDVIVKI
jgi:chaperonin GroES